MAGLRTVCAWIALAWPLMSGAQQQIPLFIKAGDNDEVITSLVLDDQGDTVRQDQSSSAAPVPRSGSVRVRSIGLAGDRVMDAFVAPDDVVLQDYATWTNRHGNGIAVVEPGFQRITSLEAGQEQVFARALKEAMANTDLNHYWRDESSRSWPADLAALDLRLPDGLLDDAFLVVSERAGNNRIKLLALDAGGEPMPETRMLVFDRPYRWSTGYAHTHDRGLQAHTITVAPLTRFFEEAPAAPRLVYGVRIFNHDQAAVKIMFGTSRAGCGTSRIPPIRAGLIIWKRACGNNGPEKVFWSCSVTILVIFSRSQIKMKA